jgi:ribosomal protein S18 acetylase RimI-like enzyme
MVHAMNALRRNGAVGFTLYVRADNAPAVRLYRDLGFEVVEEMETWQRAIL